MLASQARDTSRKRKKASYYTAYTDADCQRVTSRRTYTDAYTGKSFNN